MSLQGMKNLERLYLIKVNERIKEIGTRFLWRSPSPVEDWAVAETADHLKIAEARRLKYAPAVQGRPRKVPRGSAWFRLRINVPREFRGETVMLLFSAPYGSLIFRAGEPVQALDNGRREYVLERRARGGERIELMIEVGAHPVLPEQPLVAALNREVWNAYWDLSALADMTDTTERPIGWTGQVSGHGLEADDTRRARIAFALGKAVDVFDYGTPSPAALEAQARKVRRMLAPLYVCRADASAQTLACMGHAHIDVAWLWPLAETIRKCGRTFSNVDELMRDYPELLFVQSQPHLYEFTQKRYPGLYARIKRRVRQGRWVPTGGMWVEADCNVTGGESLVRQLLFGTRFFRREFGRECCCLWLPDVFGYSAALPQLLRKSGIPNFLTQKISWSQFTSFPHHSFHWEGIDGSRVLTHFLPADDYNSELKAFQMLTAERRYRQKDRSPVQAVLYGYGDGGGGPTREHLERLRRYRDIEGMPKLTPMTPDEFFKRLGRESADLPLWVGELYLEYHRGTYTTQAYNKRSNRKAELLLRETEMLAAINSTDGGAYDQKRLNEAWKLVLLNQFHDILPGSSIDEVYRDSDAQYAEVFKNVGEVRRKAFASLASRVDTRGDGVPVLAFNSLSWQRRDVCAARLAGGGRNKGSRVAVAPDGTTTPVQVGRDGVARFAATLPPVGHAVFHIRPGRTAAPSLRADVNGMENDLLRVDFDRAGRIRRLFDKRAGREVMAPGEAANRFILFEDKQASCGAAWDVEIFYNDKPLETDARLVSAKVVEAGPVRAVVRFERRISKSVIRQDVVLAAGSRRLDFETLIDWGDEKDVMLKVAFPVNVRAERARYEIQFGNVERPTHWNRPSDFGMFEVPAQRWADLSEGTYGVALLNDCKYGHDIRGNVMRLTLLRAPKSPGAHADVNKTHTVTYSLLPHEGDFRNGVVRAACELNSPVTACAVARHAGRLSPETSGMSLSGDNVLIDTVKKAEDDDGVIVRMYEAHGCRGRCVFSTSLPVKRAVETNLMEREQRPLALRNGRLSLDFGPFEIRTIKLSLG